MTNTKENSLYVGIGRNKRLPELMMPLSKFLDVNVGPSKQLEAALGESWSQSSNVVPSSDAEIGQRLARALPMETI